MSAIDKIKAKAKSKVMHIVLPEGTEPRTVQATRKITDQGIAKVTLLGNPDEVKKVAAETGTDLTGVEIIDPKTSEKSAAYASLLYELRKAKGMTPEQADADRLARNPLYLGAAHGQDGRGGRHGGRRDQRHRQRAAAGLADHQDGARHFHRSFELLHHGDSQAAQYGEDGVLDVRRLRGQSPIPRLRSWPPSPYRQRRFRQSSWLAIDPRVAMLSFSTKGSCQA